MDNDLSASKSGQGAMVARLSKTKDSTAWLCKEMDQMAGLNPNTEYSTLTTRFEVVSDGIHKVKETLDPMFDHYEVMPKKIVTPNKIIDMMNLICPKRDENLMKQEDQIKAEVLPQLLNVTETQLNQNDEVLNSLFRKIMIKNDNSKQH